MGQDDWLRVGNATWIIDGPFEGEPVVIIRETRRPSRLMVRVKRNGHEFAARRANLWTPGRPFPSRAVKITGQGGSVRTVSGGLPTLGRGHR